LVFSIYIGEIWQKIKDWLYDFFHSEILTARPPLKTVNNSLAILEFENVPVESYFRFDKEWRRKSDISGGTKTGIGYYSYRRIEKNSLVAIKLSDVNCREKIVKVINL